MLFRCQRCGVRAKYAQIRETFAGLVCRDTTACLERPIVPRKVR